VARVLAADRTIAAGSLAAPAANSTTGNPEQFDFVSRRLGKRGLATNRKYMGETRRCPRFNGLVLAKKAQLARRIAAARQRLSNASRP
jgi:hypothetical protein